jgi:pilus assembly protein CpaB
MAAGKKRNSRIVIYILLILVAAVVLAYLLLVKKGGNTPGAPAPTATPNYELVEIVVASQFIPRGSLITNDVLTTIRYPKNELAEGTFFTSINDAIGTKAKYNIDPAVPLTASMVILDNGGSLAAFDIPSGMTAYSMAVSPETAVAYAPQKGDHVMVVGCLLLTDVDTNFQTRLPNNATVTYGAGAGTFETGVTSSITIQPYDSTLGSARGRYELDTTTNEPIFVVPSEVQRPRLVCQTVIQDAMVLQVGMFPLGPTEIEMEATATPVIATEEAAPVGPTYPGSVTIVVSPQDTVILNYLSLAGAKLSMALKSASDTGAVSTDPVTLQYIMDQKNIPSPLKLPYGIEPRVDTLLYPTFNDYILNQP